MNSTRYKVLDLDLVLVSAYCKGIGRGAALRTEHTGAHKRDSFATRSSAAAMAPPKRRHSTDEPQQPGERNHGREGSRDEEHSQHARTTQPTKKLRTSPGEEEHKEPATVAEGGVTMAGEVSSDPEKEEGKEHRHRCRQQQPHEESEEDQDTDAAAPEVFRRAAEMYRRRSEFPQAVGYLCRTVQMQPDDAVAWAWLGYCYLMLDNMDNAYIAYQQALYLDPPMDEPHVWYGLGLLYERNRCDEQAVEYLKQSLQLTTREPTEFDRRADCTFRLGLVYKRQKKYVAAMKCFKDLSSQQTSVSAACGQNMEQLQIKFRNDQNALTALRASDGYTTAHAATEGEISVTAARIAALRSLSELWFQIGHTHELQEQYSEAKLAYSSVLTYDPTHAKVLQKLGWLYYHAPASSTAATSPAETSSDKSTSSSTSASSASSTSSTSSASQPQQREVEVELEQEQPPEQEEEQASRTGTSVAATTQQDQTATAYLERSVASDASDHQAWYLLGKCCTRQKQYQKAFRAYEQAVLLNDREPVYWCSLGILYYHNSQYHEALDTYARALQLAPELSETW